MSHEFHDDWYIEPTGESRILDQEKVAKEIAWLRSSILVERECCARIAESFEKDYPVEVRHMAKRIAEVIRRQPAPR
jgi:hypothetical protein